jgi:FtsP/CotA-like multicopper oxidase with cupredoxin domain
MLNSPYFFGRMLLVLLLSLFAVSASAASFRVQCPSSTITHPDPQNAGVNSSEPAYAAPTQFTCSVSGGCVGSGVKNAGTSNSGYLVPSGNVNGAIKCQQVSGGDGYATMGDGTQTYMFSFGPLSGLADIAAGKPGTEFPNVFNTLYPSTSTLMPGDPATTNGASDTSGYTLGSLTATTPGNFNYNGAIGLINDLAYLETIYDISEVGKTVTVILNAPSPFHVGDKVVVSGTSTGYDNTTANPTWTVSAINVTNSIFSADQAFQFVANTTGLPDVNASGTATVASLPGITGAVDPRPIIDVGVMNGNIPAPLMAIDEDDEFFLTLSNVGMIMRPDLFEQHTIHFHGYPNASAFYDGVPDASVAINIGGSFTYYYLAPDAGTYFWHCHITPPEHLQMGMVGQIYVRPRQDRVPVGTSLYSALQAQQNDPRTACNSASDILCSTNLPAINTGATQVNETVGNSQTNPNFGNPRKYAYNDGDGSTGYDVEYPLQIHGFDPNFHFVGMTFNPEAFADMKDKYFLLNGRSYPDTVNPNVQLTQSSDGRVHYSQPLPSIINIPAGGKALLRISDLDVSEFQTLASLGIPMHVIGYNAKLLRDQAGNNMDYYTNSITLGGGESLDVILDASNTTAYPSGSVFYLYTPNLDHLSNDAENFGGLMTEVHIN